MEVPFDFLGYCEKILSGKGKDVCISCSQTNLTTKLISQVAVFNIPERTEVMSLERKENGGTQHVTLYQDEVDYIVDATLAKNLHRKLVSFSFHQYVVTSIQGQSFYLRSVNTTEPSGMCIIRVSDKYILIATYKNSPNCVAGKAIPYIINQVTPLINL